MTQRDVKAKQVPALPAEQLLCTHRSEEPVGTLKCSCSHAPDVYACSNSEIVSGLATPSAAVHWYDTGKVYRSDGTVSEDYYQPFLWDAARAATGRDLSCCGVCPYRAPVTGPRQAAMEAGVVGSDAEGHCEELHLIDRSLWPKRRDVAGGKAYCQVGTKDAMARVVEIVQAQRLVLHAGTLTAAILESLPALPLSIQLHGQQTFALAVIGR